MTQAPWWRRTLRWGQTNLTEDDPVRCDMAFWREHWKRTRIQGVIVNAGGIVSYYPSSNPLQYRAQTLGDSDLLGQWADAAREEGLAFVARMDINRCTRQMFDAHPDWFCRKADGSAYTSQGRYYSCVNGGYYDEYIPSALRDIIERYHPDGFTDNSWSGMRRDSICYCDNCKSKFLAATGLPLPAAVDWEDATYRAWVRWGMARRTQLWDLFNEVTQQAGGPDCLWSGMLNADPASAADALRDLPALCGRAKIIFTDHQGRDWHGFEQNGLNGALLSELTQYPDGARVPESIAHYVRGGRTFRLSANPAQEARSWLLDGMSAGIQPWYHHIGGSTRDRRQFDSTADLFAWHSENDSCLTDRSPVACVGLLWDQENLAFYGRDKRAERVELPLHGFHYALTRARIPFLPLHPSRLHRRINQLKVLILPGMAYISDDLLEHLLSFMDNGGRLILTGDTDTRDAQGNPGGGKLLAALGLSFGERALTDLPTGGSWEEYGAHSYAALPRENRHPLLRGFEQTEILPLGCSVRKIQATGGFLPVCNTILPFPIFPPEFAHIREEDTSLHPILASDRHVLFAADIDRACGQFHLPDHARLLAGAVRWCAGDDLPLEVEGPGYLDCRMYRKGTDTLLHIVNLTGLNARHYVEEATPVGPIRVTLDTGNPAARRIRLRVAGGEIAGENRDGRLSFTIRSVGEHEMAVISE